MTTIEHLAVANLRLARRCGKLRRERDACGRDHWAADTLKVTLEHERRRSEAAEAKLADSERQLLEYATDLDAAKAKLADAERRLESARNGRDAEASRANRAEREVERLRGIIGRAKDAACADTGTADALRHVEDILREADAPPKRHLPADHKCVLCHGTGYYGDNGPGIKGNSEYQPCGCTMREADAPPAKPRRMKANKEGQHRE